MSKESESKRQQADQHRQSLEQERRIDDALVAIFEAIGRHHVELNKWFKTAEYVELNSITDNWGDLLYSDQPDISEVQATCYAVRLHARAADERSVADALSHVAVVLPQSEATKRRLVLQRMVDIIRRWRLEGPESANAIVAELRSIEASLKPK